MRDKFEGLIKAVYKRWKAGNLKAGVEHLDDETAACFLEDKLTTEEALRVKLHLISCNACARRFAIQAQVKDTLQALPEGSLERLKDKIGQEVPLDILDIVLRLKDKVVEILNTTGDVLVGYEVVPAAALRSRKIKDFKDEVSILKDFADIRLEAKIENKHGESFSLTITVKERGTSRILKDLRITLIKDDLELESYMLDEGSVTFDNILVGRYSVKISNLEGNLASVQLDIRK